MNTAQKFLRERTLIPRRLDGFFDITLALAWVERVRFKSIETSYPYGEDSYDATERHAFADGSVIVIGNPGQRTFSLDAWEDEE